MTVEKKIEGMVDAALAEVRKSTLLASTEEGLTPIERLMRAAFMAMELNSPCWLGVKFWSTIPGQLTLEKIARFPHTNFPNWEMHVFSQVVIDPYTVDFLALVSVKTGDFLDEIRRSYLVIECDGHDFHEKTKAQAAKDKSRDRFLTGLQIPVMRFTGSEIWRSPMDCAVEVVGYHQEVLMPGWRAA